MNNTKTIFKSLLIMIVAISLFTVSCSKDEGGTKTPTTPTIQKISATDITTILKALELNEGSTKIVDLSNMDPQNGNANIAAANSDYNKVSTALKNVFTKASFSGEKIVLTEDANIPTKPTGNTTLDVKLTFKANSGYEFDTTITNPSSGATIYNYDTSTQSATLTLKISPKGGNWA